jgi:hypothetical protein
MGTLVTSKREVKYTLSNDMSAVQSVMAEEVHNMVVEMWQDAGSSVRATQQIILTGFVYIYAYIHLMYIIPTYFTSLPYKVIK